VICGYEKAVAGVLFWRCLGDSAGPWYAVFHLARIDRKQVRAGRLEDDDWPAERPRFNLLLKMNPQVVSSTILLPVAGWNERPSARPCGA